MKKYKDNNLRYKLSDYSNNILLSNTFNIAHIDLFHSINKNNKEINLDWENKYFIGSNNLYLDYIYFNMTGNIDTFIELNLTDQHTINITEFLDNYYLYDFKFIIKNDLYNISSELDFKYEELVDIETDGKVTAPIFA